MNRSWMAYISAGLGGAALLGVISFHFPTLLTSRDFRADAPSVRRNVSQVNACCLESGDS